MTRIFISYSRTDESFARQLASELSNLSADIWIDVEDIPAGMKWSSAIQQGLDTADVLIVVISPESMTSRNVEDEWQYFLDHDKPVIPILLREAKIHFQLNRVQWIDFKNQPFDVALLDLHGELRRNGIKLDAPSKPASNVQALSHGHAAPPEPRNATSSGNSNMMLYAGGIVAIIIIVLVIGYIVGDDGNNADTIATIDAQNTRLAQGTATMAEIFWQQTESALVDRFTTETQIVANQIATESQLANNQTATQIQIETEQAIPTATNTAPPTDTQIPPTLTLSPTPTATEVAIFSGPVSDNSQWTVIERTIDGVSMVLVPSGSFTLGTSQEHYNQNFADCESVLGESSCHAQLDDEFNGTIITINEPYWIDQYEVSEAVYGSSNRHLPQVEVSSRQAQLHCESRQATLPNESVWEFAAKGVNGWRYPWGNSWDLNDVRANICDVNCDQSWRERDYDDGYAENSPVNEFHDSASWVGAYNMVGNVWEWTSDSYGSDATNTLRGGSWTWIQGEATTTSRAGGIAPQSSFYGFRCVRPYVEGDLERYSQ